MCVFLERPRAVHQAQWKPPHQEANVCRARRHRHHGGHLLHGGESGFTEGVKKKKSSTVASFHLTELRLPAAAGVRRLHRPAQQHRHGVRALVVREAHQHDLLPQDQGAVSLETQRPGDAAQQVLYQKGQGGRGFSLLAASSAYLTFLHKSTCSS